MYKQYISTRSCGLIFISLFFMFCGACAPDCSTLRPYYPSYESEEIAVKAAHFKIRESINTSKSSWIRGANYYSCDGKTGYFILKTDKKDYIHAGVPISIWEGFKMAKSFGSYYDYNIRGHHFR